MKELKKALDICFKGRQATRALARFRTLLRTWELAMPKVEPLVLDFGLGEFAATGLIEYYVEATDSDGNSACWPEAAARLPWTLVTLPDGRN